MAKIKYKHKFSLRVGEIAHINGIPCEYLGLGNFGTDTHPGKPASASQQINTADKRRLCGFCGQDENADHSGCLQILTTGR